MTVNCRKRAALTAGPSSAEARRPTGAGQVCVATARVEGLRSGCTERVPSAKTSALVRDTSGEAARADGRWCLAQKRARSFATLKGTACHAPGKLRPRLLRTPAPPSERAERSQRSHVLVKAHGCSAEWNLHGHALEAYRSKLACLWLQATGPTETIRAPGRTPTQRAGSVTPTVGGHPNPRTTWRR